MRSLIFSLLIIAATAVGHAQQIELEEAKVGFDSPDSKIVKDGDSYSFKVKEAYTGEFSDNPIAFMKSNFDIQGFIESFKNEDYDRYKVTFVSSQGMLEAVYNEEGELLKTYQRFTDIVVPSEVKHELYRTHKGWTMTKNKYTASGTGDLVDKELYKIKLENGNQTQRIKIDPKTIGATSVVSNL